METNDMVTVIRLVGDATDAQCRQIFDAAKARIQTLNAQRNREVAATLAVGDHVVTLKLSPKYLNGLHGRIVGRKGDKFTITIDESDRWMLRRYHHTFDIGAGALLKTEEAA